MVIFEENHLIKTFPIRRFPPHCPVPFSKLFQLHFSAFWDRVAHVKVVVTTYESTASFLQMTALGCSVETERNIYFKKKKKNPKLFVKHVKERVVHHLPVV